VSVSFGADGGTCAITNVYDAGLFSYEKEAKMIELQKAKDWGDVLLKWITIIAIPVGGWWAYYNFSITDSAEANPVISVSADVLPYDEHNALLVAHLKPKNVGKVPIELTGGKIGGDISLTIRVLTSDIKPGRIEEGKLPEQASIVSLVAENSGDYIIEPNVEYDDVRAFIVPKGNTYFVNGVLTLPNPSGKSEDEALVDSSFVIEVKKRDQSSPRKNDSGKE
jgi:hypothetical protein